MKRQHDAPPRNLRSLRRALDRLYSRYGPPHLDSDPLRHVHAYLAPADQEVAGVLSATFAYGHVPQIHRALESVLAPMGGGVRASILTGKPAHWRRRYRGFSYRFQKTEDLVLLLWLLQDLLRRSGTIERSFLTFHARHRDDPEAVRRALTDWVAHLRERVDAYPHRNRLPSRRGIDHLLPDPASGSPCKRWNLFLRWMVRGPDGVDLGLWPSVPASQLILPLDTHTARICRYLGLTRRATPSWAMAEEITRVLRLLDPDDPVRYDFSIARLGILDRCTRRGEAEQCRTCELKRICHAARSAGP